MSQSIVSTADLKRACKRLLARLRDERDSGDVPVVFTCDHDDLGIQIGSSSETIPAVVVVSGIESVRSSLFSGMAQTLRFYRKKKIEIAVLNGELRIERMVFRPLVEDATHNE
ncbi:MAG: hypothetical protein ACRD2U_01595 [Terriglobales bacterium]